jgi:regulator of replication initiation timing
MEDTDVKIDNNFLAPTFCDSRQGVGNRDHDSHTLARQCGKVVVRSGYSVDVGVDPPQKRGPGRPRKWSSEAERMRAYRARRREVTAGVDSAWREVRRLEAELERSQREIDRLRARVAEVNSENSGLRAEGRALRERLARAKAALRAPQVTEPSPPTLPRAERRRLERLQRKRADPYG